MEDNNNLETPPVTVVTNPPPINPIKPASKFSVKAIIGTIIFLLLAGGAAAGYVYREPIMSMVAKPTPTPVVIQTTPTPTPDPTSDWKTYEGDGFSFKYSPEWSYTSKTGYLFFVKKIREPQPTGSFENLPVDTVVYLQVNKKAQGETLENWAQNEAIRRGNPEFIPVVKQIKAAGIDAIETDFPSRLGARFTVFIKNDTVFAINLEYATPEDETAQKEFKNQILSTFKFTDLGSEIAGWKTYKGDGFSFKYPGNYPFTKNVDGPAPGTTDILNHNITWKIQRADQNSKCRGDGCRYSKGSSQIKLGQNSANKVVGLIGEIGGNIAENYIDYEITVPNSENLVIFRIKELPSDKTYQELLSLYPPGRKLKEIPTTETETLEQILSTFKFTE